MHRLWLLCCGTLVLGACESLAAPDLPRSAEFGGVVFRAELTVVAEEPTEVRMRVLATNTTTEMVDVAFTAPPCSFLPVVYGHAVSRAILPEGTNACATLGTSISIDAGETSFLPDEPQFVVSDRLGDEFEPGQYFFAAVLDLTSVGDVDLSEPVELGTRTIDVR